MSVIAWIMLVLTAIQIGMIFHQASDGGPNPKPVSGWSMVLSLLGVVMQVALCGRVLTWW